VLKTSAGNRAPARRVHPSQRTHVKHPQIVPAQVNNVSIKCMLICAAQHALQHGAHLRSVTSGAAEAGVLSACCCAPCMAWHCHEHPMFVLQSLLWLWHICPDMYSRIASYASCQQASYHMSVTLQRLLPTHHCQLIHLQDRTTATPFLEAAQEPACSLPVQWLQKA
jgi:hypothetical protein